MGLGVLPLGGVWLGVGGYQARLVFVGGSVWLAMVVPAPRLLLHERCAGLSSPRTLPPVASGSMLSAV